MAYTIHPYGMNNGYTAKSVNDDISSIMSRMDLVERGEFMISMMSKEDMQMFSKLFSQYCRQEINRGHCEPDCCDLCPVNSAYDEIFNRFTDDEEIPPGPPS